MNWAVLAIAAVLGLVLDQSVLDGLALDRLDPGSARQIKPSFCGLLAVFVALWAPRMPALWACFILGMLLDLSLPLTVGSDRVFYLVGPHALGYVAGGWLVIKGKAMVFRQRPLTMGVMTFGFLLVMHLVVVILYQIRVWHPGQAVCWTDGSVGGALFRRALGALYSGLFAIPIGWLLVKSMPLWGFEAGGPRR